MLLSLYSEIKNDISVLCQSSHIHEKGTFQILYVTSSLYKDTVVLSVFLKDYNKLQQ